MRCGAHDAVDHVVHRAVASGDQHTPPASLQRATRDVLAVVGCRRVLDLERNTRVAQRLLDGRPGMSPRPSGQRVDDREPGRVRVGQFVFLSARSCDAMRSNQRTGGVQYSSTNCCCARTAAFGGLGRPVEHLAELVACLHAGRTVRHAQPHRHVFLLAPLVRVRAAVGIDGLLQTLELRGARRFARARLAVELLERNDALTVLERVEHLGALCGKRGRDGRGLRCVARPGQAANPVLLCRRQVEPLRAHTRRRLLGRDVDDAGFVDPAVDRRGAGNRRRQCKCGHEESGQTCLSPKDQHTRRTELSHENRIWPLFRRSA